MPVTMKPTSQIKARLGIEPNGRVQKFFTKRCADYMDKYVPFDRGILAQYTIDGDYVIYGDNASNAYAKYQYYGMRRDGTHRINPENRDRSKHPQATSYWDKKMVSAEIQSLVKDVQDYINHGGE